MHREADRLFQGPRARCFAKMTTMQVYFDPGVQASHYDSIETYSFLVETQKKAEVQFIKWLNRKKPGGSQRFEGGQFE